MSVKGILLPYYAKPPGCRSYMHITQEKKSLTLKLKKNLPYIPDFVTVDFKQLFFSGFALNGFIEFSSLKNMPSNPF